MSDSTFLPDHVQDQLVALLEKAVADVNVDTIGEKDFSDDDALIFDLPAVRVRYDSSKYSQVGNSGRVYNAEHTMQIWCAAENLSSKGAQRHDTIQLIGRVMDALVGARVGIGLDATSDPVKLLGVNPLPDDNVGLIYIVTASVAGTAQFPPSQAQQGVA